MPENESGAPSREYADYFVSDGFNSIKCHFSEVCKEKFERIYPSSIKIYNTVNMLICIQQYQLQIRTVETLDNNPSIASKLPESAYLPNFEVVLVIDELKVISFDRF